MKKLDKKKKSILILSTCLVLLFTPKIKANEEQISYYEEYTIEGIIPYATIGDSNIYIGNEKFIDSIRNDDTEDIYVVDGRDNKNPNMRICNSYEIRSINRMNKILEILLNYEREYPTDWDRTKDAMLREWITHNVLYDFSFQTNRTKEVDLDNNDEKVYSR